MRPKASTGSTVFPRYMGLTVPTTKAGRKALLTPPSLPREDSLSPKYRNHLKDLRDLRDKMTNGRFYTTRNGITGQACRHPLHECGPVAYLETAAGEIVGVRPGTARPATPNEVRRWKLEAGDGNQ